MSVGYVPVSWNRTKLVYDGLLLIAVASYLTLYLHVGPSLVPLAMLPDPSTLMMKALGSCAFLMLTFILCIGPLARLDRRFLPLLYNRRHFGIMTCAVAAAHAYAVIDWYFNYSTISRFLGLLGVDTSFGQFAGFPFVPFGIAALVILALLAATSHDFWLSFLTPPVWKSVHRLIYLAYVLVAAHLALGQLQDARNLLLPILAVGGATLVSVLHFLAALRSRLEDRDLSRLTSAGWIDAGPPSAIAEGRAIIVNLDGQEKVAVFRHQNRLSAISNVCAHQNGPLGEGRVIDGCITCPWHGFQYRLEDGCAPAPFTERLATFNLKIAKGHLLIDPRANPPGTFVEPLTSPLP